MLAQVGVLIGYEEDPPFNLVFDSSLFQLPDVLGQFGALLFLLMP